MKKIEFIGTVLESVANYNVVSIDAQTCVATDADAQSVIDIYDEAGLDGDIIVTDMTDDEYSSLPYYIQKQAPKDTAYAVIKTTYGNRQGKEIGRYDTLAEAKARIADEWAWASEGNELAYHDGIADDGESMRYDNYELTVERIKA